MTGSQKALKVICIILVIFAILILIMGAFMLFGGMLPGMSDEVIVAGGTAVSAAAAAMVLGGMVLIMGLFYLIIGILGIRGANNPRKIGAFYVLSIIGAVLGVFGLVFSILNGTFDSTTMSSLAGTALVVVCAVLAHNVRKLA